MFDPIYPWAIVYPADPTNRYSYLEHGGVACKPRAFFIHTPEEDADDSPGTPAWFATYHADPNARGSTYYFVSYQLDERRPGFTKVYRCVDERDMALANGLNGKPLPAWADPNTSLNWQTDNAEVEGRAATIHQTLNVGVQGKAQFRSLVDLIAFSARRHGYPLDRDHIMGHYQVSVDRTDPGPMFPWATLLNAFQEDAMIPINGESGWYHDPAHQKFTGSVGLNATLDFKLPPEAVAVELEVYTGPSSGAVKVFSGGDGDGVPGLYAFQVENADDYRQGRVFLSKPDAHGYRWCYLGGTNVNLRNVGVVGYYAS